ncbi:hypothetical protein [Lentzea sp. CA-135723]|uniref:hypothetical protein n=1 Tax=Lentzea sp. CA-135723 TaxID=3239950 RepID=UPI003D8D4315
MINPNELADTCSRLFADRANAELGNFASSQNGADSGYHSTLQPDNRSSAGRKCQSLFTDNNSLLD